MSIALDQLDSIWPPYRGAVLLGVARDSQGRVSNGRVAVVAGHVALSLKVHPCAPATRHSQNSKPDDAAAAATAAAAIAAATAEAETISGQGLPPADLTPLSRGDPVLHLTVLLDAVPDCAPKPETQQMARFLTRVMQASEVGYSSPSPAAGDAGVSGAHGVADLPAMRCRREGLLRETLPDMLVVEHTDRVVSSEFIRLEQADAKCQASPSTGSSSSLVYACIEANGLLRLWKWGAEDTGWRWSFLNSCNICACREDPIGSRVLSASIGREPEQQQSSKQTVGGRVSRHRLVWEQEDAGEGAGLGLGLTPASGLRPPRTVWSRSITFDVDICGDSRGAGLQDEEGGQEEEGNGGLTGCPRGEVALSFSVCLLPTGVDALLCSRLGVWMPVGARVFFNNFATGRLPEVVLRPSRLPVRSSGGGWEGGRALDVRCETGQSDLAFTDSERDTEDGEKSTAEDDMEGGVFVDETGYDNEDDCETDGLEEGRPGATETLPAARGRRLFAVHDTTGDLMVYHHVGGAVLAVSLPSGGGGLQLCLQCRLDHSSPPPPPPRCLAVRLNVVVLSGGGVCSAYDLCTGRLLGATSIPRCRACAFRRRRRKSGTPPGFVCSCGRLRLRRRQSVAAWSAERNPVLWTSATRGHLVGIFMATKIFRLRLPGAEACLEAILAPTRRGSSRSAPATLRHLREYQRLVGADHAWPASLLPEVLRLQGLSAADGGLAKSLGVGMMDLLGHTLSGAENNPNDVGDSATSSTRGVIPPWLLLAVVSAARSHGQERASDPLKPTEGGLGALNSAATTVAEQELRSELEAKVAESLSSLDRVRTLLQDPSALAWQGSGGGIARAAADDGAAEELATLAAAVDPATCLFEGTLRDWLACRRGMKETGGEHKGGDFLHRVEGEGGSRREGSRELLNEKGVSSLSNNALALAFRCETAGDTEAQAIPFLHFLLEESTAESDHTPGSDGVNAREDSGVARATVRSWSTFLCLHMVGDDRSPLFEVACRALFYLRPRQLPRFVERLARFRAYANDIKHGVDAGADSDGGANDGQHDTRPHDNHDLPDASSEAGTDGGANGDHSRSRGNGIDTDGRRSTSRKRARRVAERRDRGLSSAATSAVNAEQSAAEILAAVHSPSSPRSFSLRSGEDYSSDSVGGGGGGGPRSNLTPRTSSVVSREHSPEPAPSSLTVAEVTEVEVQPAIPAASALEKPTTTATPTASIYFARALACLPPPADDDKDGYQRHARLSLLMGAHMFTEACRLLRARAWGDTARSWRHDRGAAEAWAAAMRLLGELERMAAEEDETKENDANAAAASGYTDTGAPPATTVVASPPAPAAVAICGSLSLQYRMAFEDALAETVLADSPDRMEMVMRCRPSGITPVAVVRMVRRAAEKAAISSAASDVDGGGDQSVQSSPATLVGGGGGGEGGGQPKEVRHHVLSESTETLKRCLLLLWEDGSKQQGGAVAV